MNRFIETNPNWLKRVQCLCGSGQVSIWQYDARGIELCRTCPQCHAEKMSGYRREVLENPDYQCDEPIEED